MMNQTPANVPRQVIPHARLKAGLLIFIAMLLSVAFVLFVMHARGFFEENQRLLLLADNSEGVAVGNNLTFSGFPIGRVSRIELGEDGKAHLHIDVPLKDARWLRESSIFTLERGVVGGARLRAFTGQLDDAPLADGAQREVLIGDAASGVPELVATMHRLIGNLERLSDEQSPLSASLNNVQDFTARLNGKNGALGALLGNEKDVARVIATLEESRQLLVDTRRSLEKLDKSLNHVQSITANVERLTQDAQGITQDIQAITGNTRTATQDLDALRAEVDLNLRKLTDMLDEINRKWPFARERELKLP